MQMGYRRPVWGILPWPLGLWFSVFVCFASLTATLSANAQDVAEAARQERARKLAQTKPKGKVYTDEDLRKPKILTPEDRLLAEAAKKTPVLSPNQPLTKSADLLNDSSQQSLGEIARRLRMEREARKAEQAKQSKSPSQFTMDLPNSFAAPAPIAPVSPLAFHRTPEKSASHPVPERRDPFSHTSSLTPSRASISPAARSGVLSRKSSPVVSNAATPIQPVVNATARTTVTIQPGDSLWKLSRQYLARGSRWQELLAVNLGLPDPSRIQPGTVLLIPQSTAHSRAKSPTTIMVQKGDSLWKLAEAQFGHGTLYPCLARVNPHLHDPNRLIPGQLLTIPASCGSAP